MLFTAPELDECDAAICSLDILPQNPDNPRLFSIKLNPVRISSSIFVDVVPIRRAKKPVLVRRSIIK